MGVAVRGAVHLISAYSAVDLERLTFQIITSDPEVSHFGPRSELTSDPEVSHFRR